MKEMKVSKEAGADYSIGEHFALASQTSTDSLEDKLFAVSMGEYQYNATYDGRYKFWRQLFRYCHEWVDQHSAGDYVEYKTEADLMSYGMMRLGQVEKVRVLPAWLATIKRLRDLQYGRIPGTRGTDGQI